MFAFVLLNKKNSESTIKTINDGKTMLKQITNSNDLSNTETFEVDVTDTNKVVIFEGQKSLIGKIINVKIISEHKWYLKGEL